MNLNSINDCVQMIELSDSELAQVEGGLDPISTVVAVGAFIVALIEMVDSNPTYYSSASWYSSNSYNGNNGVPWSDTYGPKW